MHKSTIAQKHNAKVIEDLWAFKVGSSLLKSETDMGFKTKALIVHFKFTSWDLFCQILVSVSLGVAGRQLLLAMLFHWLDFFGFSCVFLVDNFAQNILFSS